MVFRFTDRVMLTVNVGLFIRPLGTVISGYGAVVIKVYPLHLLIDPIANWDMEVADLPVIGLETGRQLVEGILIMKDALFEVMDAILISFGVDAGSGFMVSDGLEKPVGDPPKQLVVDVRLGL
jgi:hypothetical protein